MDLTINSSSTSGSSGSGRRRRVNGAAAGAPRCQVEGCGMDLRGSKAYYCRHKVCVPHSKAPRVVVAGVHQRFCQQCSRFHQLPEFDQRKRSCRRRLAGHNQRRRKPQPVYLSSCYGRFSSFSGYGDKVGGFLLNFSNLSAERATPKSGESMNSSSQWPDKLDVFPSGRNETQITLPFNQEAAGELNFSAWEIPQGKSPGVAYSGCALSLLSAQQCDATAASFQVIPDQKISSKDAPMVLSSNETNFHSSSWNFQRHGTSFKHSTLGFPQIAAYGESTAYGGDLSSQVGLTFSSNKRCWGDGHGRSYDPSCTTKLRPC